MECANEGCTQEATFELHIPWKDNEFVCADHARTQGRQDGVVADPLEGSEDHLPDGAAHQ